MERIKLCTAIVGALGVGLAARSQPVAPPQWLSDASLELRESYDNNVFLSGATAPPSYTVPASSVAALKDRASWVTTVAPSIGINLAPLIGNQTNLVALTMRYAPEFNSYHNASSESYDAHRFSAVIQGEGGPVDFAAEDNFAFIDGNKVGPFYPGNLYSSFGTTADRERRRQIQDRANVTVQVNAGDLFVRPTASLLYYDLMTDRRNIPGYQNYCGRADVNGGFDLGYQVSEEVAVTIGYRYGQQYQNQYSFSPYSAPNRYQRLLVGMEGKPWPWLQIELVSGPDFRAYQNDSPGHTTPLNDLTPVKYYGEGSLTADLAKAGKLAFKFKAWQWVAGIGKVPYYEQIYELSYEKRLMEKVSFNLGGKITSWDFSDSNIPGVGRDDLEYTVNAGVNYEVNRHLSIGLNHSLNLGRNAQNGVPNPQDREFDDEVVSLSARMKF